MHYAIAYVALFALPLFGSAALRRQLPRWLKVAAAAGIASSLVALLHLRVPGGRRGQPRRIRRKNLRRRSHQ